MSRPSRTATKIARFMLLLDAQPRLAGLLPAGAAAVIEPLLRASGAVSPRLITMMRRPSALRFARAMEAVTSRGQLAWFGLRKRFMFEAVIAAIADGATQLLVVGAGFDPLAALIAREHPQVLCVELDTPATADPKRIGLSGSGAARDNLHVVGVDLATRSIADALRPLPWRPDARSVIVAEGLLMYLDRAAVREFFKMMRQIAGPGSRLAFSCVTADDAGDPRLPVSMDWLVRAALRLAGEPIQWGIRPAALPAYLAELGLRLLDQPDLDLLRQRHLVPLGLADEPVQPYEYLALAELGSQP